MLIIGSKIFELKIGDPDNYLCVVSAKMRMDLIDVFDQSETYAMLRKGLN